MPASPTLARDQTAEQVRDRLHHFGIALLQAAHGPLNPETISKTLALLAAEPATLVGQLHEVAVLDRMAGHVPSTPAHRGGGDPVEAARILEQATTQRRDGPILMMSQVE